MRYLAIILSVVGLSFLIKGQGNYTSYNMYLGDTVCVIDAKGQEQGRWVYLGKDKKGKKYRYFKNSQIVEDGHFKDGKKTGLWKTYHSNGRIESEIRYVNGSPDGTARFFNNEGKLTAEGYLKGRDFVGDYFIFDDKGNKFKKNASRKNEYAYLDFNGKVEKFGKGLGDVHIKVERDDFEIFDVMNNQDGSFNLKLELNFEYYIHFIKEGFHEHSLIINTNVFNIYDTTVYHVNKWKIQLSDNIANSLSSDFVSLLMNKPSGKIYFNKRKKKFTSDGAYVNLFNKQVKGISESTKLILAQAADDNKKLEIENLRIEAEKKMQEINMLKQAQDLKEAEIKKKEAEILTQQLEKEKKDQALAMADQEKKIRDLKYEQQKAELEKKKLEAEKNTKEFERLAVLRKIQEYELKEKQQELNRSNQELAISGAEIKKREMELDLVNREKHLKEEELKQHMFYVYILVGGLCMLALFAFFVFRSFRQKKKANTLLAKQSEEISKQKHEIEEKSKLIEQKSLETEQSIVYAKRIQHAILPPDKEINQYLSDYFIFYRSKDIVSGDFYFFDDRHTNEGKIYIASVDCTGHGVPGAFMSMIGYEKLKDAVDVSREPGKILSELNKGVKTALRQSGEATSTRDGMDLCLCAIPINRNGKSVTIQYAGANRPLWIIRNGSEALEEIKATKIAIGGLTKDEQEFEQHEVVVNKGDTVYMFTDGYADQFGGPKKKKLMTGKFRDILLSIQKMDIQEQKQYLNDFIDKWMSETEQIDDMLVIGIRF